VMLPSQTMCELVEGLSALSQWTLIIVIIIIVIIATLLCYIGRRRRVGGSNRTRYPWPVCVKSSTTTCLGTSSTDSWLQTVMEWAWLRRHVTWRHLLNCGIDAWMTALTEQANRQPVSASSTPAISGGSYTPVFEMYCM